MRRAKLVSDSRGCLQTWLLDAGFIGRMPVTDMERSVMEVSRLNSRGEACIRQNGGLTSQIQKFRKQESE